MRTKLVFRPGSFFQDGPASPDYAFMRDSPDPEVAAARAQIETLWPAFTPHADPNYLADAMASAVALGSPRVGQPADETGELPPETGELPIETVGLETPDMAREMLLAELPDALRRRVLALSTRAPEADVQGLILDLCALRALRPTELAVLFGRKQVKHLVSGHLAPMTRDGRLERTHPDALSHPDQAYRTPRGRS